MDVFLKNSGYSEITGSLVISGSLTVNGVGISGSTSPVGLITTGSISTTQSITGSLNVDDLRYGKTTTVSVLTDQTGSIDLRSGSFYFVQDDNDPSGAHLIFSNHTEGQLVTILFRDTDSATQTVTVQGAYLCGGNTSQTNQFTPTGNGYSLLQGVCYGGVLYLNVARN